MATETDERPIYMWIRKKKERYYQKLSWGKLFIIVSKTVLLTNIRNALLETSNISERLKFLLICKQQQKQKNKAKGIRPELFIQRKYKYKQTKILIWDLDLPKALLCAKRDATVFFLGLLTPRPRFRGRPSLCRGSPKEPPPIEEHDDDVSADPASSDRLGGLGESADANSCWRDALGAPGGR